MIEQQLYTRSSNGYFLHGPGYDTVRFSQGLSPDEAKENNAVFTYNGKNVDGVSEWLPVTSRFILEDGSVMLNCSNPYSYIAYDGLKEVFISHSYIIKKNTPEYEEHAKDVRQISGITDFITSHVDGTNDPLDQLVSLPYSDAFPESEYVKLITSKYSKDFISKIVYAVMLSANSDKKVYIIPESIEDFDSIFDLLKSIYYFIPYSLRNKIGYTTLLNNQNIPNGVNIAFVSPAVASKAEMGELFGNYIKNDFCFDMAQQSVVFDGEFDFSTQPDFIGFIECFYSDPAFLAEPLEYFELQGSNTTDIDSLNLLSRFICELRSKNAFKNTINNYLSVRSRFGHYNPKTEEYLLMVIDEAYEKKSHDFNAEDISDLIRIYDLVTDAAKSTLVEQIINSVKATLIADSKENFFEEIDVCESCKELYSIIVTTFIIVDDSAITPYFERQFKSCNDLSALFGKLANLENDAMMAEDGLFEKLSFSTVITDRLTRIFNTSKSCDFLIELKNSLISIQTSSLRGVVESKLGEFVVSYTEEVGAFSFDINDLIKLTNELSNKLTEDFKKDSNNIINIYNLVGKEPALDEIDNFLIKMSGSDSADLKQYFLKHFAKNPLERRYFAYTIAYFDFDRKTLDVAKAFDSLATVEEISHYAKWINFAARFTCNDTYLVSSNGEIDKVKFYGDLANAVLLALKNCDETLSSKQANELLDSIEEFMVPPDEIMTQMYEDFSKYLKKALNGKEVPTVEYREKEEKKSKKPFQKNPSDRSEAPQGQEEEGLIFPNTNDISSQPIGDYRDALNGFNYDRSDRNNVEPTKDKGNKKKLIIIIIAVVVALVIAATSVVAVVLVKNKKNDASDAKNPTSASQKLDNKDSKNKGKLKDKIEDKKKDKDNEKEEDKDKDKENVSSLDSDKNNDIVEDTDENNEDDQNTNDSEDGNYGVV